MTKRRYWNSLGIGADIPLQNIVTARLRDIVREFGALETPITTPEARVGLREPIRAAMHRFGQAVRRAYHDDPESALNRLVEIAIEQMHASNRHTTMPDTANLVGLVRTGQARQSQLQAEIDKLRNKIAIQQDVNSKLHDQIRHHVYTVEQLEQKLHPHVQAAVLAPHALHNDRVTIAREARSLSTVQLSEFLRDKRDVYADGTLDHGQMSWDAFRQCLRAKFGFDPDLEEIRVYLPMAVADPLNASPSPPNTPQMWMVVDGYQSWMMALARMQGAAVLSERVNMVRARVEKTFCITEKIPGIVRRMAQARARAERKATEKAVRAAAAAAAAQAAN
ncbi:uncharacterized protein PFLUO_LOCUS4901 [Penicillium psychrofluorescens]|uniref:uncharacterized protein n=1 Tax=Penicillium psychrofluorescens TaxID=3158075 RepID=UPI003CCE2FCB